MEKLNFDIIELKAYRTIGMKWEGTWKEITELKDMIKKMSERVGELKTAVNPEHQLGLSYHTKNGGFVHYSVYEVAESEEIPKDMIEFRVPESLYVHVSHPENQSIGQTYHDIFDFIDHSEYKLKLDPNTKYYDPLPIKHEVYSSGRDLNNPYFEIFIPIEKE